MSDNDQVCIFVEPAVSPPGWYTVTVPAGGWIEEDYESAHGNFTLAVLAAFDLQRETFPGSRVYMREELFFDVPVPPWPL